MDGGRELGAWRCYGVEVVRMRMVVICGMLFFFKYDCNDIVSLLSLLVKVYECKNVN